MKKSSTKKEPLELSHSSKRALFWKSILPQGEIKKSHTLGAGGPIVLISRAVDRFNAGWKGLLPFLGERRYGIESRDVNPPRRAYQIAHYNWRNLRRPHVPTDGHRYSKTCSFIIAIMRGIITAAYIPPSPVSCLISISNRIYMAIRGDYEFCVLRFTLEPVRSCLRDVEIMFLWPWLLVLFSFEVFELIYKSEFTEVSDDWVSRVRDSNFSGLGFEPRIGTQFRCDFK